MIFTIAFSVFCLVIVYLIWFTEKPSFLLGTIYGKIKFGYDVNWLTLLQTLAEHETGNFWKNNPSSTYKKSKNCIGTNLAVVRKTTAIGSVTIFDPDGSGTNRTIAKFRTCFDSALDFYHYLNYHGVTRKNPKLTNVEAVISGTKWMKDRGYYSAPYIEYRDACLYHLQKFSYPMRLDYWLYGSLASFIIYAFWLVKTAKKPRNRRRK